MVTIYMGNAHKKRVRETQFLSIDYDYITINHRLSSINRSHPCSCMMLSVHVSIEHIYTHTLHSLRTCVHRLHMEA